MTNKTTFRFFLESNALESNVYSKPFSNLFRLDLKSVPSMLMMARVNSYSVSYKLRYEIKFDAPIRGHHVYKEIWTPQKGDTLYCRKDNRPETLEFDKHAVGVFKEVILVGHVPVEVSRITSYFLQANGTNEVKVEVTGKRKREIGLIVPGKYYARTETKRIAKILGEQQQRIKEKYTHFAWEYEGMEQYCKIPIKE